MGYDTQLFIEIIESTQGIIYLGAEFVDGFHTRFYQGLRGNMVVIETTDEEISIPTCKSYLMQLGLSHLIAAIFPDSIIRDGCEPFKVGDSVFELESGIKYKIVGDSETPFTHNERGTIYPENGADFVLVDSFTPEKECVHLKKENLVRA